MTGKNSDQSFHNCTAPTKYINFPVKRELGKIKKYSANPYYKLFVLQRYYKTVNNLNVRFDVFFHRFSTSEAML